MKLDNEITVKIICNYETLDSILRSNNFKIREEYQLNDIYMINNDVDIHSLPELELLKNVY